MFLRLKVTASQTRAPAIIPTNPSSKIDTIDTANLMDSMFCKIGSSIWWMKGIRCTKIPPPTKNMAAVTTTDNDFIKIEAKIYSPLPTDRWILLSFLSRYFLNKYKPASSSFIKPATKPYTPTVRAKTSKDRTFTWVAKDSVCKVPSTITSISADRIKSVLVASLIFFQGSEKLRRISISFF